MTHTTPRKTTFSIAAVVSGAALTLMLAACTTTPAADTQDITQTTQAVEAEGASETTESSESTEEPTEVVQTAFPDLEAADGEPELASIIDTHPSPGEVVQAAGPFDQRVVLEDLAFDGSIVSGKVRVTTDVSELLALQVLAGFYDDQGNLLGTEAFDHQADSDHTHSGPAEPEAFDIAVPAQFAGQAVSAAVGIPVLVNE